MLRAGRCHDILISEYQYVVMRQYRVFICQRRGTEGDSSFLRKSVVWKNLISYSPDESCEGGGTYVTFILRPDKSEIFEWRELICSSRRVVCAVKQMLHPTLPTVQTHLQVVNRSTQKIFIGAVCALPGSVSAKFVDNISQRIFQKIRKPLLQQHCTIWLLIEEPQILIAMPRQSCCAI